MSTIAMIGQITETGIHMSAVNGRLRIEAAPGLVTDDLRQWLVRHKRELLTLLAMRNRLVEIARSLGLPDQIAIDLPWSEIVQVTLQHEVVVAASDEDLGTKSLLFYLRSLAGVEPALPGSIAARVKEAK